MLISHTQITDLIRWSILQIRTENKVWEFKHKFVAISKGEHARKGLQFINLLLLILLLYNWNIFMQLMVQSENLNFHQVDLTWTNLSCYRYSRTLTIAKSSHYNLRRSILKKKKKWMVIPFLKSIFRKYSQKIWLYGSIGEDSIYWSYIS